LTGTKHYPPLSNDFYVPWTPNVWSSDLDRVLIKSGETIYVEVFVYCL